ncbi:carboxylesterase family protein [Staphylococcus lutrae]|uniref:Carboxylesterase n=1 Tax=Staphylococcus lutrae TaxID=155085 RepID=A0AAC9RUF4_9STAP|nr:carboxylesterase family protein [Staphylococcus lutrae]ARJ51010.1 carboxylesterase [Staphylococcus lutrae]PNZ37148.1 carboxylesterase/lipase family protein [Staphylococcus lutrae]
MEMKTPIGTIFGTRYRDYEVFKGIPYAHPPIGSLRFKHAQRMTGWPEGFQATAFGPVPIQPPNRLESFFATQIQYAPQSENCLTLNIWRPTQSTTEPLPVIVYVYGGSFINGHSAQELYHPHEIVKRESVIVVTFNYRLGALGFLDWSAIHPDWDINNGLSDQYCALQWVSEHIHYFGGDPQRITMMGQSAGAMSIQALLRMPQVRDLVKNAVLLSGVLSLESPKVAREKAHAFQSLKTTYFPEHQWHDLHADDILALMAAQQAQYGPSKGLELLYQPVATPQMETDFHNVTCPILLGLTTSEGDIYIKSEQKKLPPQQFQNILARAGHPIPTIEKLTTAQQQRDMITALYFNQPFQQLYQTLSQITPTWRTIFNWSRTDHSSYSSAYHILDVIFWMGRLDILTAHGLEITNREQQLSTQMIHDLCHFARHGTLDSDRYYE